VDARRRRVVWTQSARLSLEDILGYIAKDSPAAASRVLDRILEKAESLDTLSKRGRVVSELARPNVREVLVYSYRVLYEVTSEVRILALVHGARDFESWRRSSGATHGEC
jgi:plasmid stabilization system protein ParE